MSLTNNHSIPLEMAVWLAYDDYDYIDEPNYISATSLLRPIRHIVLPPRIPPEQRPVEDLVDLIARAMGNALHAGIEQAWKKGYRPALRRLGYPEHIIDRVVVNPSEEELAEAKDPIVVWVEQRAVRQLDGFSIGGKFDLVCDGQLTDTKSTSAYTWVYGPRKDEYLLQGSIYRWLNPDKITNPKMRVNFIFTDWSKSDAARNKDYPQKRVDYIEIDLLSPEETEAWIRAKLAQVEKYRYVAEEQVPQCTDEELWMTLPIYKYFSDPKKAVQPGARSSRNFDPAKDYDRDSQAALRAANAHLSEKGKGVIVTVPGTPKRCGYCPAFPICTQKDQYTFE